MEDVNNSKYIILNHFKKMVSLLGYQVDNKPVLNESKYDIVSKWVKVLIIFTSEIFFLYESVDNIYRANDIVVSLTVIGPTIHNTFYYFYFHKQFSYVKIFINEVENNWSKEKDKNIRAIIERADEKIKRLLKFFMWYMVINTNYIVIGGFIKDTVPQQIAAFFFKMPLPIMEDFNKYLWLLFPIINFLTHAIVGVTLMSYIMMIMFSYHIQAQSEILLYKIALVRKYLLKKNDDPQMNERVEEEMKNIIKCHISLLRMVKCMNNSVSLPNILLNLISCLQCCLALFISMKNKNFSLGYFNNVIFLYLWPFLMAWYSSKVESVVIQYSYSYYTILRDLESSNNKI